MPDGLLATAYRFKVTLERVAGGPGPDVIGKGGFQECTGLDVEMEVNEYLEGGRNAAVVQRVGRARYPRIVLKRGMLHQPGKPVGAELWQWIQDVVSGVRPVRRYSGDVEVCGAKDLVVAHWRFERALPAKVVGPQLNGRTGEVAMEELHLAHEGLRLVTS